MMSVWRPGGKSWPGGGHDILKWQAEGIAEIADLADRTTVDCADNLPVGVHPGVSLCGGSCPADLVEHGWRRTCWCNTARGHAAGKDSYAEYGAPQGAPQPCEEPSHAMSTLSKGNMVATRGAVKQVYDCRACRCCEQAHTLYANMLSLSLWHSWRMRLAGEWVRHTGNRWGT